MSYDLAVWAGPPLASDDGAVTEFPTRMAAFEAADLDRPAGEAPDPRLVAFAKELLAAFPDISEDDADESPWSIAPLTANLVGPTFLLNMRFGPARSAVPFIAERARGHGLVCFDPQTESLLPAASQQAAASEAIASIDASVSRAIRGRYAVTVNGLLSWELSADADEAPNKQLARLLTWLDGDARFALVLWELAPGHPPGPVRNRDASPAYIQCAGDYRTRLVCEIREHAHDNWHQYAIGRPRDQHEVRQPDATVVWDGRDWIVPANEALTGPEILEVFVDYLDGHTNPAGYTRRDLDS